MNTTTDLPAAHQLKITLADSTPEIWRRVLVPQAITLADLHYIIQRAMGWESMYDYQFSSGLVDKKITYAPEQDFATVLANVESGVLYYLYDATSGWLHKIQLEALEVEAVSEGDVAASKPQLPACLGGEEACPPEGTGGIWGYEEFLERLDDSSDPEYLTLIEKYGDFDPAAFDAAEATARLQTV